MAKEKTVLDVLDTVINGLSRLKNKEEVKGLLRQAKELKKKLENEN